MDSKRTTVDSHTEIMPALPLGSRLGSQTHCEHCCCSKQQHSFDHLATLTACYLISFCFYRYLYRSCSLLLWIPVFSEDSSPPSSSRLDTLANHLLFATLSFFSSNDITLLLYPLLFPLLFPLLSP